MVTTQFTIIGVIMLLMSITFIITHSMVDILKAIFNHCHHWLVCDVRLQYCDCDSIRCYGNQGKKFHVQICGNINFHHFLS